MRRRDKTTAFPCGADGCREYGHYAYANREDLKRLDRNYGGGAWRCVRHSKPGENLSLEQPVREVVLVASKVGGAPGLYWLAPGSVSGSGFSHGPGFKAWAYEVPEGTRLVVRAELLPPG